uniref:Uncharacterized protein n=1 Tax=Arundo donax TaxID=35708 RepID=A0A0A9AU92_ARUDO
MDELESRQETKEKKEEKIGHARAEMIMTVLILTANCYQHHIQTG